MRFSRIIAGLGYVVLQPQYRGSTGYGSRLPAGDLPALRRSRLPRRRQRDRLRHRAGLGRSGAAGDLRLECRRLHDVVDGHSDQPLSRRRSKAPASPTGPASCGRATSSSGTTTRGGRRRTCQAFVQFSAVRARRQSDPTPLLVLHGESGSARPDVSGTRAATKRWPPTARRPRMVTYPGSGPLPGLWEQRRERVSGRLPRGSTSTNPAEIRRLAGTPEPVFHQKRT